MTLSSHSQQMDNVVTASADRRRLRIHRSAMAGFAVLALGAAAWAFLHRGAVSAQGAAPSLASLSVTATAPRQALWGTNLDANGVVAPWQEAIIGAQTSGLSITSVHAAVGDAVRRGQMLARFNTSTLRAEEVQLLAALAQAHGVAAQADANSMRARKLKGSDAISEQEVQRFVTEAVTAQSQVASVQAQLEVKRLQLRQADVVAPDDGVISARTAALGMVANNGQELFRLVRQGRLEWRGEFTATQIANITIGQEVTLQLPEGKRAKAHVRQIAPLLETRSRLGLVYAEIVPGSTVRGGMYIEGRIALPPSPAQVVSATSVVVRDGRSILFRLEETGAESKVTAQPVTVGRRLGKEVEILDSLGVGARVVAQGAGLLADGDTVRVESSVAEPMFFTPVEGRP